MDLFPRYPPRGRAISDVTDMLSLIGNLSLSPDGIDKWTWSQDNSGIFKRASINRLPTRTNLISRGVFLASVLCPFCKNEEEDIEHCLIRCPCVLPIGRKCGVGGICPPLLPTLHSLLRISPWASWLLIIVHILKRPSMEFFKVLCGRLDCWISASYIRAYFLEQLEGFLACASLCLIVRSAVIALGVVGVFCGGCGRGCSYGSRVRGGYYLQFFNAYGIAKFGESDGGGGELVVSLKQSMEGEEVPLVDGVFEGALGALALEMEALVDAMVVDRG
ncbi:RNA-directed DNA polymerase, eukaryota, reverse transcriptase zinc-binding domain protein [Tanacetum coccineum]